MSFVFFGFVRSGQASEKRARAAEGQTGRRITDCSEVWAQRLERLCSVLEMSGEEAPPSGGF